MRNLLLASSLASMLVGLASPHAHAELNCGPMSFTVGNAGHKEYVTRTDVSINGSQWIVRHYMNTGAMYDRSTQYNMVDKTDKTAIMWRGVRVSNPRFEMSGAISFANQHVIYNEWVYYDSKLVGNTAQDCGPIPAPAPQVASAPVTQQGNPSVNEDSVMLTGDNHGMHVQVNVGGHWQDMLLDTGAAIMSVSPALANQLVIEGKAHYTGDSLNVTMADGSTHPERVVMIDTLSIGKHTRTSVAATVSEGMALLPLPILNAIGKFSIDMANNKLTFN